MFPSRRIITSGTGFRDDVSCYFDGSDQINLTEVAYNVHNANYTFSFWMKRETWNWDRILSNTTSPNDSTANKWILLGNEGAKDQISLECDTDNKRIKTDQHEGKLNTWYHIVITTNGSGSGAFYENGKSIALASSGSTNDMDAAITIDGIGQLNNGWINDLAVYDTDIGAAGARELYNDRQPFNHKEGRYASNLINWWRMGDGAGDTSTTIKDQAGTNNGTLAGDTALTGDVPW